MKTRTPILPFSTPTPTRILVVEDDEGSRESLVRLLQRDGYEISIANDGQAAIDILLAPNPPRIALLDWEMPRLDGIHVCCAVRSIPARPYTYIIMVTAKAGPKDALAAFAAGVDDFLSKPIDSLQLLARLRCGERVLDREKRSSERIAELEDTLKEARAVRHWLPTCMYCKKVRDSKDRWHELKDSDAVGSEAETSNAICPDCMENVVRPETGVSVA